MQIRPLNHPQDVRSAFVDKFVMDWQEFQIVRKEFIQRWHIKEPEFDRMLMWDKMRPEHPTISFRNALALLRGLTSTVWLLSEGPNYPYAHPCRIQLDGQQFPYFAAAADARDLADLIEYEWMEDARLNMEMCQLENPVLPQDLYICTPEMDRMIVFTHETNDCDEDFVKAAESRLCIAFGFDQ